MPDLVFANRGAAEAIRTQEKINDGARQLQDEYKQSAREAANLERAAKRVYEQQRTPQEKLIKKMGEIKEAQRRGLIPPKEAEETLKRLGTKMEGLESQSNKTFGNGALGRLATFAGGLAPIGAAIAAITAEFRSQFELVEKAAQTQLALVPSRQNLIDNLVGRSPKEIAETLVDAQKIALSRGVPEVFINDALGAGVSASSGDLNAAIQAVDFAARKFADRPEQIEGAVGASLDLNAVTKSTDPRVAAGLLAVITKQARLTKASQISENAPKALTGAVGDTGFGATLEGGASLFSTLSSAIKDKRGDVTKTAVIGLGKALEKFEGEATGLPGLIFRNLPTLDAQILALQRSPELRKQLFSKPLPVPGEAIIPIRNLLTGGTDVANQFLVNRAAVPGQSGLIKLGEDSIKNLGIDPLQPIATAKRQIDAVAEDFRRKSTQNLDEETRLKLVEILQRTGKSNLSARGTAFLGQLSDLELGISVQEASDILEGEARRFRGPKFENLGSAGTGAPGVTRKREATEAEKANAEILQRVSDILERSVKVQEEQRELTKETNRKLANSGIIAGAD